MRKNEKKINKKKSQKRGANIPKKGISFRRILSIGIVLLFFLYVLNGSIDAAILAKNGIVTKGVIVDIRKRGGGKPGHYYYYRFYYNGRLYTNSDQFIYKEIGDSVDVIFLKDNPKENHVIETLENTYGYFLRRNPNLKSEASLK